VTVFVVRRKPAQEFKPKSDLYSIQQHRRSHHVRLVTD